MKILAIEKEIPGTTEKEFMPHLKAEAASVWKLYQAGVGGILIRQIEILGEKD
jgi:hypothetical protein